MKEQAAKDSNRVKSQFLANVSSSIRGRFKTNVLADVSRNGNTDSSMSGVLPTPIMLTHNKGVIGMAELLGEDPNLTLEQQEYVNSI